VSVDNFEHSLPGIFHDMSAANPSPHSETDVGGADLVVVHEAVKLIGQAATPEIAISSILRLMSQMLGLNRGRVLLPVPGGDALRIRYSYGLTDEERARGTYGIGEGITGTVYTTGQPAVVQNVDEEPNFLFRAVDRATLPPETVAFIAVPVMDGDIPMGVLGAHRIRLRPRSINADLVILRILATLIAQMLKINALIDERTSRLAEENKELKDALDQQQEGHGILGESQAIRDALRQVLRVADTGVTVLLTGESGTGKERFAQILHLNSSRKDNPFLAINCAAIPEQLLESELFGHERGAFTGASAMKMGKLELAKGGTLFLDEIGDMNLELQSKLLRVLENKVIQRVGGVKDIPVDVRIVAATHKNLQQAVNAGSFRMDLFYRLNVFPLHLPPLRDRDGDIRILVRHILLKANQEYGRNTILSKGVMTRFEGYNWPGNIRQLENVVKRAVLIAQDGVITVPDIESILRQEASISYHLEAGQPTAPQFPAPQPTSFQAPPAQVQPQPNWGHPAAQHGGYPNAYAAPNARPYAWVDPDERETLIEALRSTGGNKTRAAMALGMTARQFRYRLEKLGIS